MANMHKNMRGAFPLLHVDFSFLEVQYTAGGPLLGIVATFLFIHATNPTTDLILLAVMAHCENRDKRTTSAFKSSIYKQNDWPAIFKKP